MISHDNFEFGEKVSHLMDLEEEHAQLNDEILAHGRQCSVCLIAQMRAGLLPRMTHPTNVQVHSAEEFFFLMRN